MKKLFLLFVLIGLTSSCAGGRLPSPKAAHSVVSKHFQKYGKKYKESDFGKYGLERVEIVNVEEIQKDLASVEAYTYLSQGPIYWVRVTFRKKPFGWKSGAWETLGVRAQ